MPRRERILGLTRRVKVNDHTPVTLEQIEEKLEEARAAGYAISDSEYIAGLRVLSAPILGADGFAIAALSVAAPSPRMSIREFVALTAGPVTASAAENRACLVCCRKYGDPVRAKIQQVENLKTRPLIQLQKVSSRIRLDALKA